MAIITFRFQLSLKRRFLDRCNFVFFFGEIHLPIFRRVLLRQDAPEWHQELVDGQLRCFTRSPPGVRPGLERALPEVGALHPVNGGLLALRRAGGPTAGGAGADRGEGDLAAGGGIQRLDHISSFTFLFLYSILATHIQ